MWRHSRSFAAAAVLVTSVGCAGTPKIASVALFPAPFGVVGLRLPAPPTPSAAEVRMICTGRTCTVCDTVVDTRNYLAPESSVFASFNSQGMLDGPVEIIMVRFADTISLARATEILTAMLRRPPVLQDSLQSEWSDGRDQVRVLKARGRGALATLRPVPRPSTGPGCPAR